MKIRPTDIIPGTVYLKLINDYKAYDARQKEIIEKLRKKIDFLEWQVEDLRVELEDTWDMEELELSESVEIMLQKLRKKIRNQREALQGNFGIIHKLRRQIEDLMCQNEALIAENTALKSEKRL